MAHSHLDLIRRFCSPLEPIATDVVPALKPLPAIHAVLFDIYGTLFISASGDVGTASGERRADAFIEALSAVGISVKDELLTGAPQLRQQAADQLIGAIHDAHAESRRQGIEYPEVEITAVWADTLGRLETSQQLAAPIENVNLSRLAVEYEVRTNPTWPMPGLADALEGLHQRELALGIISNAQFFTPELFPAFLGQTAAQLGFAPELQFYSYRSRQAKPGTYLYQAAATALLAAGIAACDVLYIGNDMLNDIVAAHQVGFRTALFAGDARSLRLRQDDARVGDLKPDLIVTNLSQVADCLGP